MRHKFLETCKYIASIGNYHWDFPCISSLSAISIADGLNSHNEKILYTSELSIGDNIRHMAYFKRRDNTETNTAFFPLVFVHYPKNCPLVSAKSLVKPSGFPYVIRFFSFPFKQGIRSTSFSFWLKQCLIKWVSFCPFNLKALYSHFIILFYTAVVIDSNTPLCYPLAKRLEGSVNGKSVKRVDNENGI